jgi:hypothetical protein
VQGAVLIKARVVLVRSRIRVISLNLRSMPNRAMARLAPLVELLDSHAPDLVLLQECRRGWCEHVCEALGMDGAMSHDLLGGVARLPADGTAVCARRPLRLGAAQTLAETDFDPAVVLQLLGAEGQRP